METPNTDAAAGSSPASDSSPVTAQAALDSFSHEERSSWEATGTLPERIAVTSTKTADSSSATPAAQAASTDARTQAASEPAAPAEPTAKGAKLKARNAELDEENRQLQEKLRLRHSLREELARTARPADATPAASSTAKPAAAEYERYLTMPGAPQEADFDSIAKFTAAMGVFIADQRYEERATAARTEQGQRQAVDSLRQAGDTAKQRLETFAQGTPDFAERVHPGLLEIEPASLRALRGEAVGPEHVLAEEVLNSEHVGPLLVHFSTPEGQQEWARMRSLPPAGLLRAFVDVEARLKTAAATPTAKHVSTAPNPAITVGSRASEALDPIETAVKGKDFSRYEREANKRTLASLGR